MTVLTLRPSVGGRCKSLMAGADWQLRSSSDQGKIYREPAPREVPRFELFFDLLFVAIIHNQGQL